MLFTIKILFVNLKELSCWLDPGLGIDIVGIGASAGIIRHSFLPNGISITADVHCEELDIIIEQVANCRPALVNRSAPLLLYDNARPHTPSRRSLSFNSRAGSVESLTVLTRHWAHRLRD